jgi:arylformamidase
MRKKKESAMTPIRSLATLALLAAFAAQAGAGPLRDRLLARRAQASAPAASAGDEGELREDGRELGRAHIPDNVKVLRNVAYGNAERQRLDVYLPPQPRNAPVLFLVHGGGWHTGDKTMQTVVENKVAHWCARGFIVISTNYRLVPEADPLVQAGDVARALTFAQDKAAGWGGDRNKFVLMGHSAGAHLVTLITASPSVAGGARWLGTVALDSAAYDVEKIMEGRHFGLYDKAFGTDPAFWRSASPIQIVQRGAVPLLGVCSSRRHDSCAQAEAYAAKARGLGLRMQVLPQDLSHREINGKLGEDGAYTEAVDAFVASLMPRG